MKAKKIVTIVISIIMAMGLLLGLTVNSAAYSTEVVEAEEAVMQTSSPFTLIAIAVLILLALVAYCVMFFVVYSIEKK